MISMIRLFVSRLIPKIHNLPRCIYINWLGYEWIFQK